MQSSLPPVVFRSATVQEIARSYGFAQETRPTMRLTVVAVVMAVEAVESNEPAVRALSCPGCR